MRYKTFYMSGYAHGDGADRRAGEIYSLRAFIFSLALSLIAAVFVIGMLYIGKSADMMRQPESVPAYETMLRDEKLSAFWRVVGGIFPYLAVVVRLFLMLCAFFAFVARMLG